MSDAAARDGRWHVHTADEVCRALSVTAADGLSSGEVALRR